MAERQPHAALPLKYRPMTFDDVVGQEHVVRTLRNAIASGRVANAYLFIGPRGIGKTTLSRIFAKALNCAHEGAEGVTSVEPCGHCVNCEEIAAGRSLDVTELDAASHNKVEDVKPIIDAVQFKPTGSRFRIFIIDECHMLSGAAWNALLKTLEEPPPYVRFIFATTEGDKVLPTIVSRCQRFDLRRIQTNDIAARLKYICAKEGVEAEEDALLAIARGAEGGMRDALSSLDQLISFRGGKVTEEDALGVFGLVSRSALEGLAASILKGDTAGILTAVETFDSAGKNMRRVAGELLLHFRNLVVVQALGTDARSLEATPEQLAILREQAKGVDPSRLFRICDQLSEMEDRIRHVLSVRTLIEMTLLRASRIAVTATVEELMRAVRELRGGASPAMAPVKSPAATAPSRPVAVKYGEHALPSVEELMRDAGASAPAAAAPAASAPVREDVPPPVASPLREDLMNDRKLNEIIAAAPGAVITEVKEARR